MNNDFFEKLDNDSEKYVKDKQTIKNNSDKNPISAIIKTICYIILICGFIIGLINYSSNENIGTMLISWLTYGMCSLSGFALAEIIQILHDIRNKLYKNNK